jgi:hypothetical protein
MSIASITDKLSPVQRLMFRQAPDAGFFQAYTSAYARYQEAVAAAESPETVSSPAEGLLADLLGQTHIELSRRRGVSPADQTAYADILDRAYSSGAMLDPAGFLKGLSREELAVVQRNHSLADPIDPAVLSREGAYNLLLPEGYGVDFNHDDLIETGIGRTIQFPPADAPEKFVNAWFSATQGMSEMDAASYGLAMFTGMHNIPIGDQPLQRILPTDAMASYRQVVANFLDMLERLKGSLPAGQYERDTAFFGRLQDLLG